MQPVLRRILYVVLLMAGLAWIFVSADKTNSSTAGHIPAPQKGFFAPEFSLTTQQNETISLSQLRGKAIVINLWATWCPPCKAEMPTIEKLYEEYKDQGLVVLGVNSTIQDDPSQISGFIQSYSLTFPILLDVNGDVSKKYNLQSLPSSFFVNRDGTINDVVIGGPMSEALLRSQIQAILNSKAN